MEPSTEKKKRVIQVLKANKFEHLKGSRILLDKIKRQKTSLENHQQLFNETDFTTAAAVTRQQQESHTTDESVNLRQLLLKQQSVLNQLNEENVQLIQENGRYKCEASSARIECDFAHKLNHELKRENRTLKRKYHSVRHECDLQQRELVSHNREMNSMGIKIQKLKQQLIKLERQHN
jgi:chromosome segregation ATPase